MLNDALYFKGTLDEARIESTIRSSNWVWASWMTVASNTVFASYSSVTQQPPALSISTAGGQLFLGYPTNAGAFPLYATTNLAPPVAWTLTTNQPLLLNTQWQTSLPFETNSAEYYRLQSH